MGAIRAMKRNKQRHDGTFQSATEGKLKRIQREREYAALTEAAKQLSQRKDILESDIALLNTVINNPAYPRIGYVDIKYARNIINNVTRALSDIYFCGSCEQEFLVDVGTNVTECPHCHSGNFTSSHPDEVLAPADNTLEGGEQQ